MAWVKVQVTDKMLAELEEVRDGLQCLDAKDQSFAGSLVSQWDQKGWLSEKQWYWLGKLWEKLRVPDFTKGMKDELDELETMRVGKSSLAITPTPCS